MVAMLQDMFDAAWARGRAAQGEGATIHTHIQHGFAMLVAYVERHHAFLRGALEELSSLSAPFADALAEQYATELDFFGTTLGAGAMALVLAGTAVLFAVANLAAAAVRTARR